VSSKKTLLVARIKETPIVIQTIGIIIIGKVKAVMGIGLSNINIRISSGTKATIKLKRFEKVMDRTKIYFGTGTCPNNLAFALMLPKDINAVLEKKLNGSMPQKRKIE
jgi:hypothetical protein